MTDTPLTEAESAVAEVIDSAVFDSEMTLVNEGSREMIIKEIVAAVAPIIRRETLERFGDRMGTLNPPLDVNQMNRGFGDCPHCMSPPITRCHECGTETFRDHAVGFGWRMDHLSGFGCIALCRNCRDDNL
jgi:hypothetical protein